MAGGAAGGAGGGLRRSGSLIMSQISSRLDLITDNARVEEEGPGEMEALLRTLREAAEGTDADEVRAATICDPGCNPS